jgi:acyl carrier protein
MDDVKPRLLRCFQAVFPDLPETQLLTATQDSVDTWDSVAMITLVNVIDEEFNVQLDLDRLDRLSSFESLHNHLQDIERPQ